MSHLCSAEKAMGIGHATNIASEVHGALEH